MGSGVNHHLVVGFEHRALEGIDLGNLFNGVPEEIDAHPLVLFVGREDLHPVPPHPEDAPVEVLVVAGVLDVDELGQQIVPGDFHVHLEGEAQVQVIFRCAQAVDAGDRGHHDDIPPGQHRPGGGMAHLVDHVVDGGVLLDVGIR